MAWQMTCGSMLGPPTPVALVRNRSNLAMLYTDIKAHTGATNQARVAVFGELSH
ncbi:MAG: hypothetical protein H0W28_05855 [Pyrinomonadaceae bacterium]|nr:hypothetical protein [Pyrinomonadaceae bacterium]